MFSMEYSEDGKNNFPYQQPHYLGNKLAVAAGIFAFQLWIP